MRRRAPARGRGRAPLLAAVLACALLPAAAAGQGDGPRWALEVRAGAVSPKGDLGDVADDGQMVAVAVGYRVTRRLTLGAEGALQNLERGGRPEVLGGGVGPDVELWPYLAVAAFELTEPGASRWEVLVRGGAGGTRVEGDATDRLEAARRDEPTGMAAVDVGFAVGRSALVFVRADGYLILGDSPAPGAPPWLGKETVLTHTVGLRVRF